MAGAAKKGCQFCRSPFSAASFNATYICYDAYMKRTTIFLPDELHEQLRQEAFTKHLSMAQIIRGRLELNLRPPRRAQRDVLAELEGIVHDGTLSQNIDEELYSA